MNDTHVRILQVALLAPPAAALGFARGIDVTVTHGMVAGVLTCTFIVSAIMVLGFVMGELYGSMTGRQTVRSSIPRYQKKITPDIL
ncbi:MAG: hypothetical protein LUQ62_00840 [Methanomicrobiales archaeon]|nr:hypothetical protein [Methanomicrobiales archaeon]